MMFSPPLGWIEQLDVEKRVVAYRIFSGWLAFDRLAPLGHSIAVQLYVPCLKIFLRGLETPHKPVPRFPCCAGSRSGIPIDGRFPWEKPALEGQSASQNVICLM
jgi:hypothetical protein